MTLIWLKRSSSQDLITMRLMVILTLLLGLYQKIYTILERKTTYSPSKKDLQNAHLNIDGIHIDKNYIITDNNISIDLGGMGKGYGADKVAEYLDEQNITEGISRTQWRYQMFRLSCEIYLQSPYSEQTFAKIKSKHHAAVHLHKRNLQKICQHER